MSTNLSPIVYPAEPICRTVNYETIDEQLSNRSAKSIDNTLA